MIVVVGEALIDVVVDARRRLRARRRAARRSTSRSGWPGSRSRPRWSPRSAHDERGGLVVQHVTRQRASRSSPYPPPPGVRRPRPPASTTTAAPATTFDLEWTLPRQELPPLPTRCTSARSARCSSRAGDSVARPGRAGVRPRRVRQLRRQPARAVRRRPRARLARRASRSRTGARLVKLSDEDVDLLRSRRRPRRRRPRAARRRAHRAGRAHPRRRRGDGVHRGARRPERRRPRPVEVVDTVGAGDAFMAGTARACSSDLDAFGASGAGLPAARATPGAAAAAARWRSAAITCERRGANPPTRVRSCLPGPAGPPEPAASRSAASTWSITTGSTAMPQWLVRTSTCSAAGSRQARQSTMPSRLRVDRGEARPRGRAAPGSPPSSARAHSPPKQSALIMPAEAGPACSRVEHLGVPGEHRVDGARAPAPGCPSLTMPSTRSGRRAARPRASMPPRLCPTMRDLAVAPDRDRLDPALETVGRLAGAAGVDADLRAVGAEARVAQEQRHRPEGPSPAMKPGHQQHRVVGASARWLPAYGAGRAVAPVGPSPRRTHRAASARRCCPPREGAQAPWARRIPAGTGTRRAVSSHDRR